MLVAQTDFSSGELAAGLLARTDLPRYKNGAATVLNWQPLLQGGVRTAPGSAYVATLAGATRIEPHQPSLDALFLLAFRDRALDIYTGAGLLHQRLAAPWTEPQLWELDLASALDTVVIVHQEHAPRRLYRDPGGVFHLEDLSDTSLPIHIPQAPWRKSKTWASGSGGPRTVCFHEARLVFGGSKEHPNRVWCSQIADFFNFDAGTGLADEAFEAELLSDSSDTVQWVASLRNLMIGTAAGEWAVVQSQPLTPELATFREQSRLGSARVRPVSIDGALVHVTRSGRQIQELLYSDVEQAYSPRALSMLAPQALTGARQLGPAPARAVDQSNLVYCVNADGMVGVLSSLRDQEVLSWCRRTFQGAAESVAVLGDAVWLVVRYEFGPGVYEEGVYEPGVYGTAGGSALRLLVKLDEAGPCLDFHRTVAVGAPTTTWAGFGHLAGTTVTALLDGAPHPDLVVAADGTVTTEWAGLTLTCGVPLPIPTLAPMPVGVEGVRGSSQHQPKRLLRVQVQLVGTRALEINGAPLSFRTPADPVEAAPAAYTGVRERRFLGWNREASLAITSPGPWPATVLALTREVVI